VGDDVTFNSWISRVRTRLLDGVQEIRLLLALDLPILLLASGGTLPLLGIVLEHAVVVVVVMLLLLYPLVLDCHFPGC